VTDSGSIVRTLVQLVAAIVMLVAAVLGGAMVWSGLGPSTSASGGTVRIVEGPVVPAITIPIDDLPVEPAGEFESYEVFGGKNPFERPIPIPEGGVETTTSTTSAGQSTTTSAAGSSTTTTSGGSTTSSTSPGTTKPGSTTTTQGGNEPIRGTSVTLLEVFVDGGEVVATVRVNGTVYKVSEGDVFAGGFLVVSLDLGTGCGVFQYGGRQFGLCEGEQIIK
jgi:hypothetical protein